MDDFKRMAVFAAVVQQGSMTAAARALGLTPSAVSQQVRALEAQAGLPLMQRTTRKMSLTEAGQRFHAQCVRMVEAAAQARAELEAERSRPEGELRIAATVGLAVPLGRALAPVLHAHPQLRLHLVLDDAHTDLVTERIDLAIRLGKLPDSSWVARPLGSLPWWLCAAPALLAGAAGLPAAGKRKAAKASAKMQPPITQPAQLQALPWVMREAGVTGVSPSTGAPGALAAQAAGATQPGQAVWLQRGDERQAINPVPRVRCTQQLAVQQLCLDGLGVAQLFSLDVAELVARGELLRLLPDWDCGQLAIWALTPDRQALPARVRVALKAIQAHFAQVAV